MKSCILIAATLFVLSCASTPESYLIPPLGEAILEGIQDSIERGAPVKALQDIKALAADGNASETVMSLETDALDVLVRSFDESVRSKDYDRAISLYRSAAVLGKPELLPGWTIGKLVSASAWQKSENGDVVAALLDLYGLLQDPSFSYRNSSQADIDRFTQLVVEAGDRGFADYIIAKARAEGIEPDQSLIAVAARDDAPSDMLQGVVTVWVNRGIKVENGIGFPDRVIGSGFFIDKRGYILTNHHVIESEVDPEYDGYSRLFIRTSDNPDQRIPAKVVAWDRVFDLALLKAEIDPKYVFSFSMQGQSVPGQRIFAIGSPGGLENTITSGIVSATERRFLQMGDAVQVDVPINPGNSGGPLLDENGRLIGVVFAGIEQFEGINFAIPAVWVTKMLSGLFDGSAYVHSWIGASVHESNGALEIMYSVPGAPAYSAGLRAGDFIRSINGVDVEDLGSAQSELMRFRPDTLIKIGIEREGTLSERYIALADRPFSPVLAALKKDTPTGVLPPLFGMSLVEAGSILWEKQYLVERVYAGGIADETGISVNDPVSINSLDIDEKNRVAILRLTIKKRKAGFIESSIQIGAYLEVDSFL